MTNDEILADLKAMGADEASFRADAVEGVAGIGVIVATSRFAVAGNSADFPTPQAVAELRAWVDQQVMLASGDSNASPR